MGLEAIYPKPRLSQNTTEHRIYPYLLRNLKVVRPNQVWASDITYVPMPQGWMYLTVVMDWFSRCVLSWRLSNTLDGLFCLEASEAALRDGAPEIFNTDQGVQYTAEAFTGRLEAAGVRVSMGCRGRWMDNVFRGAIVADGEVRAFLSARLRDAARLAGGAVGLVPDVQRGADSFVLGIPHADGGVPGDVMPGGDANDGQVSRKNLGCLSVYSQRGGGFAAARALGRGSRAASPLYLRIRVFWSRQPRPPVMRSAFHSIRRIRTPPFASRTQNPMRLAASVSQIGLPC